MDRDNIYEVTLDDSEVYETSVESEIHFKKNESYLSLTDKPKIEGITLEGDKSFRDFGLGEITAQDIDEIIFGGG